MAIEVTVQQIDLTDLSIHGSTYARNDNIQRRLQVFGCIYLLNYLAQSFQHVGLPFPVVFAFIVYRLYIQCYFEIRESEVKRSSGGVWPLSGSLFDSSV